MVATFNQTTLQGYSGFVGALQWGPDGKLYVAERFGDVKVITVEKSGNTYTATNIETIDLVKNITNHNDDGSVASGVNDRQVTGIAVGGTADNPIIYVSSSDPRIGGGGSGSDKNVDTNSGIISQLTNDNGTWEKVDLVRGLPRSEENHATNGLQLSADGSTLYAAQGGHANTGAPSNNFSGLPEYAYSAAILEVDLNAIDALSTQGSGNSSYKYDLPTLDDPDRPNDGTPGNEFADGSDVSGPFGGNDGFNQAKIEAGSPVQVFAPGYRNPYDVLLTSDGKIYTYDNGANNGWGGRPVDPNGNIVTSPSQIATNQGNEDSNYTPQNFDNLHEITNGQYGGHPNPIRASGEQAGLILSPGSGLNGAQFVPVGDSRLPADFDEIVFQTNPIEGVYQEGGFDDQALDTGKGSVNGLAEFTSAIEFEDGTSIQGALLATDLNGEVYIIPRNPDGSISTVTGSQGETVAAGKQIVGVGGGQPLGIDARGDEDPDFAGTIWVGKLSGQNVTILTPGTAPDPSDDDIDDDGLDNTVDPFALDPDNGTAGSDVFSAGETVVNQFDAGTIGGTLGGTGFTGALINNEDAFDPVSGPLFDADNLVLGGAGSVVQIKSVQPGDTFQGNNTGQDNLQYGVTFDNSVDTAAITLTMENWIPGATSSGGFPSAGLQIGAGDQNDYVKLVLAARNNNDGDYTQAFFEAVREQDGSASNFGNNAANNSAPALLTQEGWVQLRMLVDIETGDITPQWRFGTGASPSPTDNSIPFTSGNVIPLTPGSDLLQAVQGNYQVQGQDSGLAVGIIATSNSGTPFVANFDSLAIQANGENTGGGDGDVVIAINAGTGGAISQDGIDFQADQHFSTPSSTFTDNQFASDQTGNQAVYDGTVYETERFGASFSYNIPDLDPTKEYEVELRFAEIFLANGGGPRVMDVAVEGTIVLNDLDILEETGNPDVPYTFTSGPVGLGSNGTLDIDFTAVADNAKVSAIIVREVGDAGSDQIGPGIASVTIDPPAAGDAAASITVVYQDPSGVDADTIEADDIAVTGPGSAGAITVASETPSDGGNTLTVVYSVAAPSGGWTDGSYAVEVQAGEIADTLGNTNASSSQGFTVATTSIEAIAINAGGPALVQVIDGETISFAADNSFSAGATFTDSTGGNGSQPVFDGTIYETERNSSASLADFSYNIDVSALPSSNGLYDLDLHFAELFQSNAGDRVMDVFIEGELVLDDFDILAETGDINVPSVQSFTGLDAGGNGTLDVTFTAVADRAAITGLVVRANEDGGGGPTTPPDSFNGQSVGDFSDDEGAPSAIDLGVGTNTVVATQQGDPRDYDYITFSLEGGEELTAINLSDFDPGGDPTNNAFLALIAGTSFPAPASVNPANLLGGVIYGSDQIGENLLPDMADGTVEGRGTTQSDASTIGFDTPLGAGDYTLWFSQNGGTSTSTLEFEVQNAPDPDQVGAVRLGITEFEDDVQISNFGSNSFQLDNVGDKSVARVEIDVTNALFEDAVFDPFGVAGDTVTKALTINTNNGTGVIAPTSATSTSFDSATATYIGAGGTAGFEGIVLRFDELVSGGFQNGEALGFSIDMDPNSIAGADKPTLDGGTVPAWDVGGVSGAELIGTEFRVTFTDGTTATGQIHGAGNQAGAKGLASQAVPAVAAQLSVSGVGAGGTGTYGSSDPVVVVDGPAGETVRVVMAMGMIQPENNNFTGPFAAQLDAQLDALAASPFPANNIAEFQTVDVVLTGSPQDISNLFDFSNVDDFEIPGEGTLPLAFTAAVIDPAVDDLVKGPVTAPIVLTHDGDTPPPEGAYLPNVNGDIVFEVEDAGLSDQGGWTYKTQADEAGHEPFTGEGFYVWEGGPQFGTPGSGVLSYQFTPDTSGVYYVNIRGSRVESSESTTDENDTFVRILDGGSVLDARDGFKNGTLHEPDYTGDPAQGWLKSFQSGGQTTDWLWANKNVDDVGIPIAYELVAGQTYTIELSGRSPGHEIDRVHIDFIPNPPDPAAGETTNALSPNENAPLSPQSSGSDTAAPTVTIEPVADIEADETAQIVAVVYDDETAFNAATIDVGDVVLNGPNGLVVTASGVTTTTQGDGSVRALYTFDAPAGGFAVGAYAAVVQAGAVADVAGNLSNVASDGFEIVDPSSSDVTPPTAAITPVEDIQDDAAQQIVTVVYDDETAFDTTTIDAGDVVLNGPAGAVIAASGVETEAQGDGSILATYTFDAPTGGFAAGPYIAIVQQGAVADAAGNQSAVASDGFEVTETGGEAEAVSARLIAPGPFWSGGSPLVNVLANGETVETIEGVADRIWSTGFGDYALEIDGDLLSGGETFGMGFINPRWGVELEMDAVVAGGLLHSIAGPDGSPLMVGFNASQANAARGGLFGGEADDFPFVPGGDAGAMSGQLGSLVGGIVAGAVDTGGADAVESSVMDDLFGRFGSADDDFLF